MARQFLSAGLTTAILLAFSFALASSQAATKAQVGATLQVTDGGRWRELQKGIAFRTIALERSQPAYTVDLKLLRFDSQMIAPRVLSASDLNLPSASAKIFAQKTGAIAAINASYFDDKGRPLAYLKTLGKEINRAVSKHSLYTGIFVIGESGPLVIHRDDFQPAQASEGLQSGPLLLHHGATAALTGDAARYARRSVIGVDKQGHIVIGVTDAVVGGLSFTELQELFMNPRWQIGTTDLLNLDGGGSAQLYIKSGKFEEWLPGTSEVPVAIGFFTKPN